MVGLGCCFMAFANGSKIVCNERKIGTADWKHKPLESLRNDSVPLSDHIMRYSSKSFFKVVARSLQMCSPELADSTKSMLKPYFFRHDSKELYNDFGNISLRYS